MTGTELGGPAAKVAPVPPGRPAARLNGAGQPPSSAAVELASDPLPAEWPDYLRLLGQRRRRAERAARRRRPYDWAEEGL